MIWLIVFAWFLQEPLKFVKPGDLAFAGNTSFQLRTTVPVEQILGLELFINGDSVHYFEEPPFETEIDMTFYRSGPVKIKAVLYLFSGGDHRVELEGNNYPAFVEEDVQLVRVPVQLGAGVVPQRIRPEDFQIFEEGLRQNVTQLYDEEQPLQLVVLLDLSGSMEKRLVILRQGVRRLIDMLKPGDSVQVIGFNHYVFEISPPDTDLEKVKLKLSSVRAEGDTNLFGAVWSGVKTISKSDQRRAMVLFTDGEHGVEVMEDLYNKTLEDCVEIAREKGVPVYAMGMGFGINPDTLNGLAEGTGGKAFILRSGKAIHQAFETIGTQLRKQYLLCYYSPSTKKGWHDIDVRLPAWPEVVLRFPKKLYFK